MLGQAINNIGMTDMAKEAATSVTTFEGAMGNLEASAVSGMMKLYDTFAKPKVIDSINGMTGKVEAGFDKLSVGIPKAIELISPYWNVLKTDAKEVGTAFGEAAGAIIDEVQELTGAFGKKESVDNFSESMGTATGALTTFADFLKDHDKEVAKAITLLPKLYVAFKGFKIVSAVAPGVKTFAGAIVSMTGKGIATLAGKLFGVAAGEKAVGAASKESSGTIVESAKAFVAIGAGVALIAAGFSLLAYSAVQIAQAGPLAAKRLLSVATQFDNAEIGFGFKVENMAVTGKYINVYKKRGNDSGVTLTIGKEVSGFRIKSSIADLATAYRCTGGTPEGSENPITLNGYKYDDGDFYVEGSYVKSRKALEKWSRYQIKTEKNKNDVGHIVKSFTYDTTSKSELCNRAVSSLKKICDEAVTYEVELLYLPDGVKVGDTVSIVDDDDNIYLTARL